MFPQFGATAESLSKASSLMFRLGTDAHLYDDPDDVSIAPLLDSRFDSEKIEALKRLLALISQGSDVSNFFPQVVKNVASQTMELKKLVYLYLLHYAEKRPNEALLSINYFQKDLSDPNPLVRARALRTMAGIRLHAIASIVLMAVTKCAKDPSAYVRKCAANALSKLNDLRQDENISSLEELVSLLLNDQSPGVIGAAAAAYNSICPHNFPMIGRTFKRLCEALPDIDEWGQISLVDILLRYVVARHGLVQESIMASLLAPSVNTFAESAARSCEDEGPTTNKEHDRKHNLLFLGSYLEGSGEYISRKDSLSHISKELHPKNYTVSENNDVKLLLQCTSPLLWSQNSAVILAAASVHWIMSSKLDTEKIVKPLLFLLRSSISSKYVVLCNIQVFSRAMPSIFAPYFEDFFVCSSDLYEIRALKLEILSNIATESSVLCIFKEFQDYIKDPDRKFAADTVAAIGLCAQRIPSVANTCLEGLLTLIQDESSIHHPVPDKEADILVEAIVSIKAVISQNPSGYEKVVVQLASKLDAIKYPSARALIVWMVGEYCSIGQVIRRSIPILLKYLARSFTLEDIGTKHQILNATAKVVLTADGEELTIFIKILHYLLQLAKSDVDYDIRDRARVMDKLLIVVPASTPNADCSYSSPNQKILHNLAKSIFCGKIRLGSYESGNSRVYLPGSLSQVVLHAAPGYEPLPRPCSILDSDVFGTINKMETRSTASISVGSDDSDTLSGSSEQTNYDSHHSASAVSDERSDSDDNVCDSGRFLQDHIQNSTDTNQLICLDTVVDLSKASLPTIALSSDMEDLMSKSALESWLEDKPSLSDTNSSSVQGPVQQVAMRISVKEIAASVKPKIYRLLEPINGNGLKVDYSFAAELSKISPLFTCVEISFENLSTEPLRNITIRDVDENLDTESQSFQLKERQTESSIIPKVPPFEEILLLEPNQKVKKILQVHFQHHLLPLKLVLLCCDKKYPVKLQPDIGYFIKPLSLDLKTFQEKELKLPGMFEYTRSCTFTHHLDKLENDPTNNDKILFVSGRLASKVLSSANVFFVSVDMPISNKLDDTSGLRLRFSGETLSTLKPCLVSVTAEGKYTEPLNLLVKVNCEETIFGLNLLNRFVAFLSEN